MASSGNGIRPTLSLAAGRSLGWLVDDRATARGDWPFLIWEPPDGARSEWTYATFARGVRQVSDGLRRRGLGRGDRLLLHLDNSPEFLFTWFACTRLGATAVCTNMKSSIEELTYFGEHAAAVAAVTQPSTAPMVSAALPGLSWTVVTSAASARSAWTASADSDSFLSLVGEDNGDAAPAVDAATPAWIQYTSGTTSRPKGVVLTHANALWGGKLSARNEGLTADDVHFVHLPLFHINALCYSVLSSFCAGATVVLVPRFSASRFWEVSKRNRCTWASVIPFTVEALSVLEPPDDHHYRLWGNGISIPASQHPYGIRNIGWYGMTETVAHPIIDDVESPGPFGTMGRVAPGYEVAVLAPDGSPTEPEQQGSLFVRGTPGVSLFAGYLHDPAATAEAVDSEGWLATGDRAVWHADGSLSFGDRAKDMLKVGGENVAASEVERVVIEVAGVAEVAVVAAPDRMLGEVPIAFVTARAGAEDLAARIEAACQQRLSSFKVPREIRIVESLPRSTLNKIAKAELRLLLRDETTAGAGLEV